MLGTVGHVTPGLIGLNFKKAVKGTYLCVFVAKNCSLRFFGSLYTYGTHLSLFENHKES